MATFRHKLGYVFGIPVGSLVTGVPGTDPRFIGTDARRLFVLAGGMDAGGVSLETEAEQPCGAHGHWRLSQIPGEIMTAYGGQSPDRPDDGALSAITLGALIDQGHQIRLSAPDPYRVTGASAAHGVPGGGALAP